MENAGVPPLVRSEIQRLAREDQAEVESIADSKKRLRLLEPPSCMATIDELDKVLERYLLEPQICALHPEEQAVLLGSFNDPLYDWNTTQYGDAWRIEMILQASLLDGDRPLASVLSRALAGEKKHHFVSSVSGAGKTSAITDVAKNHFVVYFQCEGDRKSFSRFSDFGYSNMVRLFHGKYYGNRLQQTTHQQTSSSSSTEEDLEQRKHKMANDFAKQSAKIELVCRLAQLRKLLHLKPDLTPFEYFLHQHFSRDNWVAHVRTDCSNLSENCCRDLIEAMCKDLAVHLKRMEDLRRSEHNTEEFQSAKCAQELKLIPCKLVLVLDELEAGMSIDDDGRFDTTAKKQGFAAVQARAYDELIGVGNYHVVYLGPQRRLIGVVPYTKIRALR